MQSVAQRAVMALAVVCVICVRQTNAHGRLIEPPSRSSMWRFGFPTQHNYNDNQLSCGGFTMQWVQNGGLCGMCGDPYNGRRENEAGGKYATGTIVRKYAAGETITVTLDITMNHGGYFEFRICPNNNPHKRVTESCLNQYLLRQPNGQTRWQLSETAGQGQFSLNLVLPRGLTCSQCVLQWKWNTASSWGCDNSGCGKGHGKQEQFYGCADVAVSSSFTSGFGFSGVGLANVGGNVATPAPPFSGTYISASSGNNITPAQATGGMPIDFIPVGGNLNAPSSGSNGLLPPGGNTPPGGSNTMAPSGGSNGFIPSGGTNNFPSGGQNNYNYGFIPPGNIVPFSPNVKCEATPDWKSKYAYADQWCMTQCLAGNCPRQYCQDGCRRISG